MLTAILFLLTIACYVPAELCHGPKLTDGCKQANFLQAWCFSNTQL